MAELNWIRDLQCKETAFNAHKKEFLKYFKNKKYAFGLLSDLILPTELTKLSDGTDGTTPPVSVKKDGDGNVVLIVSEDVYRLHYLRFLELVKTVITEFKIENVELNEDHRTIMLNTFSQVFKRHVRSFADFEKSYDYASELLKQNFGAEYDLELFKLSGENIFSKTSLKDYQKKTLRDLENLLQDKDRRSYAIAMGKTLFTVAADKVCNIFAFFGKSFDHWKKYFTTTASKSAALKLVSGSFEECKKLADNREIVLDNEFYNKNKKTVNFNVQRQTVEELWPETKNAPPFNADYYEDPIFVLFNIIRIALSVKNKEDVPDELKFVKTDITQLDTCAEKLGSIGERVKRCGKKITSYSAKMPDREKAVITYYVEEGSGIVASYRTRIAKDIGVEIEKLINVSWIDNACYLDKVLLDPKFILENFLEFEKHCEGLGSGLKIAKLRRTKGLHKQLLDILKVKRCNMRDASTVVHHVAKHGDVELFAPIQTATGRDVRRAAKAYLEKVRRTANNRTVADIKGNFTQQGNYRISVIKAGRDKTNTGDKYNVVQNVEPGCFAEMYFSITPQGVIMLITAY